ncbi:hypothetical protein [Actinoplanes sp. NPDC020271]|uniref:hypothetical protein n=1 Tax=Actinoplanes sp. NPDC020271 TaxID=3363896 RepID=UPI0037ABF595
MSSNDSAAYAFPAWLQIVLAVLGLIGTVLSAWGLAVSLQWSPRRANEEPRKGIPLSSIRFWRPTQYALALGNLMDFVRRLQQKVFYTGKERGHVTESDLVRWIIQLALTCAAQMVPQSLGKANLFRVSSIIRDKAGRTTGVRLYSSEFVGVFSTSQLINVYQATELRNVFSNDSQSVDQYPAALQCVAEGLPTIQSLARRKSSFDQPERSFGATHVLAIPLQTAVTGITYEDQVVSITVDLKYGRLGSWLLAHRGFQKFSVYRRANRLAKLLSDIPELSDHRFLPSSDHTPDLGFDGD